jgi:CBS domain-containing protein
MDWKILVVIADRGISVLDGAKLMRQHHVGTLVVVKSSEGRTKPIGIITDRDIVLEVLGESLKVDDVTLGDVMSHTLHQIDEGAGLYDAYTIMRSKGVRRLPVVNADDGLVGILSADDLVEIIAEQINELVGIISREQQQEKRIRS